VAHALELLIIEGLKRRVMRYSGVVDQDRHRTKLRLCLDHCLDGMKVCNISTRGHGAAGSGPDFCRDPRRHAPRS